VGKVRIHRGSDNFSHLYVNLCEEYGYVGYFFLPDNYQVRWYTNVCCEKCKKREVKCERVGIHSLETTCVSLIFL